MAVAVVSNAPIDGCEAQRFCATHARVWAYLHQAYALEPVGLDADVHVFLRGPAAARGMYERRCTDALPAAVGVSR